jgi:DNA-binding CsgD family transcriptional regulator
MPAASRPRRSSDPAPQPCPSGVAPYDPLTPTLLARAGTPPPHGSPPPPSRTRLPALVDEFDELVAPHARHAVELLGYRVLPARQTVVVPGAPASTSDDPAARFVGAHGLDGVVSCRVKYRLGLSAPQAAFTVVYVARDEVVAALHRLHRCADVVVVLRHTPTGAQFHHVPWPSLFEHAGVTAREAEVLALLLARRTNAEIAQRLVVSPATVRAHCRSIFCKLGAGGRRDLWARFSDLEGCVA